MITLRLPFPRRAAQSSRAAALVVLLGLIPAEALAQAAGPMPYAPQPGPVLPSVERPVAQRSPLTLRAQVSEDGPLIRSGLVWRVMKENPARASQDDKLQLVAVSSASDAEFLLEPGSYLVHVAYGRAAATARLNLTGTPRTETLILNAGGLKLSSLLSGDKPLQQDQVSFDIFSLDNDQKGDKQAVVLGAKAGKIIRLNADTYQVVAHYGDVNATSRAEISVQPGKLTEATMYQKAARMTFKLVSAPGGEALTNVNWNIISRTGDPLTRMVGAFPAVILAAGEYSVIAKQGEQVFTRDFTVDSGYDREIEVTAK